MSEAVICHVYRSPRRDGLYLFVPKEAELSKLPEAVMRQFGTPEFSMELEITPERQLARTTGREVLESIAAHGFHLQLPPRDHHVTDY